MGTEQYHWSQTANPRARPDSTGSASGGNTPMMSDGVVAPFTLRPERWSWAIAWAKLVTKPLLAGVGGLGAVALPNSCALVFA